MKFSQFKDLNEAVAHEQDGTDGFMNRIELDEAVKLIKANCKNVDVHNPLYRGMRNTSNKESFSIEGQKGLRKSSETSNHYTLIIDHLLQQYNKSAPLRSKSIICTNDKRYADGYGTVYAILPYDNVEIGQCDGEDIWGYRVTIGDWSLTGKIADVNDILDEVVDDPKSYEDIVNRLAKFLDDEKNEDAGNRFTKSIYASFKEDWVNRGMEDEEEWADADKKDVVEYALESAYHPEHNFNMQFGTYKELEIDDMDDHFEFWFGGKCVAIRNDIFERLVENGEFE